jgi:hypothetical protein
VVEAVEAFLWMEEAVGFAVGVVFVVVVVFGFLEKKENRFPCFRLLGGLALEDIAQ